MLDFISSWKNKINGCFNKESRVRLVAIAKDEGAYLPQWIHHHLSFGFNEIEIYVNNTTDNTIEVLETIQKKYPQVAFIDADYMYDLPECEVFQHYAYNYAYQKAVKEKISHLLFLDIDEFWTPLDFESGIHDCLLEYSNADIISFEWVLKRNEETPFSYPFAYTNSVNKNHLVKSIFDISLKIDKVETHNVKSSKSINILANGKPHPRPNCYSVDDYNINYTPIKKYFILHRVWRSQLEYLASIGQGMKAFVSEDVVGFDFKSNRDGYLLPENRITTLDFDKNLVEQRENKYKRFIEECNLAELLGLAMKSVVNRVDIISSKIKENQGNAELSKVMRNINFDVVENEKRKFKVL